eukprot:1540995-Pleurochrysis_carterae.AAC.1
MDGSGSCVSKGTRTLLGPALAARHAWADEYAFLYMHVRKESRIIAQRGKRTYDKARLVDLFDQRGVR